jgi:hypothetical protein
MEDSVARRDVTGAVVERGSCYYRKNTSLTARVTPARHSAEIIAAADFSKKPQVSSSPRVKSS